MNQTDLPAPPTRRGFLKEACAILLGTVAGLVPLVSGLVVFFDPLRRKSKGGEFVSVASLNALPEDGAPRKFAVIASRTDAWNKSPQTPIGAVYLRRTGEKVVQALNVVCPHAGCFVDYNVAVKGYRCPCHDSTFALSGQVSSPSSPAPRGLDELEVEIRNDGEIWVKFQNFRAGQPTKTPA
jgi:menaquinol-cytochrome c reductase iron-sulfur subunit